VNPQLQRPPFLGKKGSDKIGEEIIGAANHSMKVINYLYIFDIDIGATLCVYKVSTNA
jgi:hypothetical protein